MSFAQLEPHLDPTLVRNAAVFADHRDAEPTWLWRYRGDAAKAKRGFWALMRRQTRWPEVRRDWATRGVTIPSPDFQTREYELISAERIEELESFRDEVNEPRPVDVPWHFTELMRECVAQFTLRNIPRAERYIDLDMPMHYEVD